MNHRWRMVAVAMGLATLAACSASGESTLSPVAPSTTTTASAPTMPDLGITLSPKPSATSTPVPASRPTRLDIGGAHPIHAKILPYDGQGNPLEPPDGNYHDLFVWTGRGGGLPGDGASDMTILFGHSFSGDTEGVLDHLQDIVLGDDGQLVKDTPIRLTTETGRLTYCVRAAFTVLPDDLRGVQAFWAPGTYNTKGDYLGIIVCRLSDDGSTQSGLRLAVLTKRC